jgi:signal transduction histidine kinase
MEFKLKTLFKKEVALKGRASTFSFACFAIFSYIYGYSLIKYLWVIKITSVIIFIASVIRFFLNRHIIKLNSISESSWLALKTLIWINAIGWGIILNTASFELKLSGIHFIVVTTLLAGLVSASIVSISYFKELFIPFQAALLLPQIIIILYYYYLASEKINLLPLIFLYIMYFIYQINSFRSYRKDLIKLFKYQLSLEKKNSKLKESQKALVEQSMILAHASRLGAIGEMSATIAHEINNPIAIISAGSKIIAKELDKDIFSKDFIVLNTERINRAVLRIGKIIKGLQNLSNQSDHLPKEKISLKDIIEDTSFFCGELLISKNIILTIGDIPERTLNCHPVQISQVLINLIKNAADVLTDETNPIEKWILIKFEENDNHLRILISNGGPKILNDISSKIFEPFFTTKTMGIGNGLGLSISKKIIRDHGGDINIDLKSAHTTFTLELHLEKAYLSQ